MRPGWRFIGAFAVIALVVVVVVSGVRLARGPDEGGVRTAGLTEDPIPSPWTMRLAYTVQVPATHPSAPILAVPELQPTNDAAVAIVDLDGDARSVPAGLRGFDQLAGLQVSPDGRWFAFSESGRRWV